MSSKNTLSFLIPGIIVAGMPETQVLKILAQLSPAATTDEVLYAAPDQSRVQVKSIFVCNRGANATFRIAVVPAATGLANKHYLFYDQAISLNDSYGSEIPIFLSGGDYINIRASSGNLSFTIFGNEG